ncbi:hypothetical protein BKA70DRAFT_1225448 [Coprinopsis sp. MPI-PUGE-AT-0042]|nr:hypothetical protein BKA70DRAFT_1225448 [Coprinopsis sp. MPI-PUGE-AT-0042]
MQVDKGADEERTEEHLSGIPLLPDSPITNNNSADEGLTGLPCLPESPSTTHDGAMDESFTCLPLLANSPAPDDDSADGTLGGNPAITAGGSDDTSMAASDAVVVASSEENGRGKAKDRGEECSAGAPKDRRKGKEREVTEDNLWAPFSSRDEFLKWTLSRPVHEMTLVIQEYVHLTSKVGPGVSLGHVLANRLPFEEDGLPEKIFPEDTAEEGRHYTIFGNMAHRLKDILQNNGHFDLGALQVGTISSAGAEEVLRHLRRWLGVLVGHYDRNCELVAVMNSELNTLHAALSNGLHCNCNYLFGGSTACRAETAAERERAPLAKVAASNQFTRFQLNAPLSTCRFQLFAA